VRINPCPPERSRRVAAPLPRLPNNDARRPAGFTFEFLTAYGAMTFSVDLAENLATDPVLDLGAAIGYRLTL
jgi:hypothetical protein